MGAAPTAVEVFCSYAHEDEAWRQKLETHLSLLRRQGLVSLWHDRLISPGTDWAHAIDLHLETASIILLFVSANFFDSDYCYGIEMQQALKRHEAGEARVIPLLVRPVDWKDAPFAQLQALPTDARPLSIWQDEDTALTDVVAGIRRVLEDLPLLSASAPRAALPAIWNIPYPRNPFFLWREGELAQVRQRLQASQTTALAQPQAISGLGGIGKTQLALEYAYRYHQDYQAVLWAHAESTEALISSYVAIASLLRLPEQEAKEQEVIVQAVKTWLQIHRDWLLILDNADELTLLPDFLPPSLGGHLLLTTRATATGRLAHRMEIETWLPEQGALFLLRRGALIPPDAELSQASQEEREQALHISQELGGLPLALDQAGAYLEETGMDLAGYWHIYQQHRADLLRERRGLVADHPTPVATTWSISFQRVEEKNSAAADLLRLCAYLAPESIPEEIVTQGAAFLGPMLEPVASDSFLLSQAIEVLRAYSLIGRDPHTKTLSIHRLVQIVLQDAMSTSEQELWIERVVAALESVFPQQVEPATWSHCERLTTHVLTCMSHIQSWNHTDSALVSLLANTARYLHDREQYTEAEPLLQQVLYLQEQEWGPDHPEVAVPLINLAQFYSEQDKYSEAESLFQRALLLWEQALGPNHPNVTYPLNGLAMLYSKQGKYTQAELLCQRALRLGEQEWGPDDPNVTLFRHNLADLYCAQGKYSEAEPLLQQVLYLWEQELGSDHPNVAYPLAGLADLYCAQGKYTEAELLYQRALRIWEQQLGPEHPLVASSLNGLANLYYEQGKYAEAEPLYQRALRIREQARGPEHPKTAEVIHDLARFWEAQGNHEEARSLYTRALAVREQTLGAHHPETTETRTRLIALLHALGQHEKAAQLEMAQAES